MTRNGGGEISQDVEALEIASFSNGQQARRGQFAVCTAIAEADFAPLHARTERSFGAIVGRLDTFEFQESEQPPMVLEKSRGKIADLAVGTVQIPLGQSENPFLDRDRTQQQLLPIHLAAAKLVPEPEESGVLSQSVAAESLHRTALGELHNPQQVAFQVSPAELRMAGVILQVRTETVAAQHTPENGSQQSHQHFAAAGGSHCVDHVPHRDKSPQEALVAVGPPARLIDVQHRFILQLPFQFLAPSSHRLAGFFPTFLRAPQTHLDSQHLRQQRQHHPARHATYHRQIGNQGRQPGAEVSGDILRQSRARALSTLRTYHAIAPIFDDPSLDGRKLSDLLPLYRAGDPRLLDLGGQSMPAVPALFRQDGPNLVDSFGGNQGPIRSAMAGLPARLPSALLAPAPLARLASQSIGGWRLGGVGGVLFAPRQLPLQIRDLLLGVRDLLLGVGDLLLFLGDLPAQLLHCAAQTLVLAAQYLAHRR